MKPTQCKEFYDILSSGSAPQKIHRLKELTGQTPDLTGLDRASDGLQEFWHGGQFYCSDAYISNYVPRNGHTVRHEDVYFAYPSATYHTLGGRPFWALVR